MEIYDYYTSNGLHKYGFRIFTDDSKKDLSYESCGFDSYDLAQERMKEVLKDFEN